MIIISNELSIILFLLISRYMTHFPICHSFPDKGIVGVTCTLYLIELIGCFTCTLLIDVYGG